MNEISLFGGTGFIGAAYFELSKREVDLVDRNNPAPKHKNVLYAIGTTDNYNIFENPYLDIETNLIKLIADLELLRAKFGTFTFNFLSSWFVYGDGCVPPFSEDGKCSPKGFYSISKYSAELFLKSYCETYGVGYRILRLANVFGVGDKGVSKKKNALQYLIHQIRLGNDIDVYEGGEFVRDYIDVRDVVSAIDVVLDKANLNEIINIGTGEPSRFIDLLSKAKAGFNSRSQFNSIHTPTFHARVQVRDAYLETSKLKSLGFVPKYSIADEIINL